MNGKARLQTLTKQTFTPITGNVLQRCTATTECSDCRKKREGMLQRAAVNNSPTHRVPSIVYEVLRSPGQPLDTTTRAFMEPRFGHDFSQVRVHTDGKAAESARAVNALAYTVGRDVVFGTGQFRQGIVANQQLLAHELMHVIQQDRVNHISAQLPISSPQDHSELEANIIAQSIFRESETIKPRSASHQPSASLQRVTDSAESARATTISPTATSGTTSSIRPRRLNIDVLAAEDPDDFLVRAAAHDIGIDIRVRSMNDMVSQVANLATGSSCVASLEIFNHANPSIQTVSGGNKVKLPSGNIQEQPVSGFSLSWLFDNSNRDALDRLRDSFCCNGVVRWFGCSTAGVLAGGGRRTEDELRTSRTRYKDWRAEFYQSVEDAAAHGATRFRAIGSVNVQSWANALCTPITAATDFNSWNVTGSGYSRTVIYGGRQIRVSPQADIGCACDPETGRISGTAPTTEQIRQRATELRELALSPNSGLSINSRTPSSVFYVSFQNLAPPSVPDHSQANPGLNTTGANRAGYTRFNLQKRMSIVWDNGPVDSNGRIPLYVKSVNIFYRLDPIKVFVSSDYNEGSCPYRVTLAHERSHVEAFLRIFYAGRVSLLDRLNRTAIPTRANPTLTDSANIQTIQDTIGERMRQLIVLHSGELKAHMKADQASKDSPTEYRAVYAQCSSTEW